jgi:hypothetical protein
VTTVSDHYIRLDGKIWRFNVEIELDDEDAPRAFNYVPTDLSLDTPVVADYDAIKGDEEGE